MDVPPLRYVRTSDGVNLATYTLGQGPPLLFAAPIGDANFPAALRFILPNMLEVLTRHFSVTFYEPRNHGASDHGVEAAGHTVAATITAHHLLLNRNDMLAGGIRPHYYCLPVLAGERLVARFDFKAQRKQGVLRVLSCRFEETGNARPATAQDGEAARAALDRYAEALELKPVGQSPRSRGPR